MHALNRILLTSLFSTYLLIIHLRPYILQFKSTPSWVQLNSPVLVFLTISTILSISTLIYKVFLYPFLLSPIRHFPGPPNYSIWNGQFPLILNQPSGEPQIKWMDTVPNNGLIRYLAFMNGERIMPTNSKTLQEVLHTKSYVFQKPEMLRSSIGQMLGLSGMLFSEGDEHKFQRKHMLPAFSYKHLRGLVPKFWEKSFEFAECLEQEVQGYQAPPDRDAEKSEQGPVIEISSWLSRVTLDIIGSTGFGYEFNTMKNNDSELVRAYRTVFIPVGKKQQLIRVATNHVPKWIMALVPIKARKEALKSVQMVKDLCLRMVREKKRELEISGKVGENDILSLITKDSPFSEEVMRDQLMTFLAAGHETTASALVWALYLMSLHPNIQSRLRTEIHTHLPSPFTHSSSPPPVDLLDNLPYLRACTLEILRFFSPVPMTLRVAAENTTINGEFIPKGTVVMLSPWAINRSKKVWGPTADVFDPERWILYKDGKPEGASNYDFMTFLHGPRSCIGKDFSRLEFKALLSVLVGRFEWSGLIDENGQKREVVIRGGVTIKPENGMPLRVKIVDGW